MDAGGAASRTDADARAGAGVGEDSDAAGDSGQSSSATQSFSKGKAKRPKSRSSGFEELRSLIVVTRHGERTPKQKLKMLVRNPKLLQLFERFGIDEKVKQGRSELKLKKADELQQLLDITLEILASDGPQKLDEDQKNKFLQIILRGAFQHLERLNALRFLH